MFDTDKKRIVILSIPRSGSRALYEYLKQNHKQRQKNSQFFSEPDSNFYGLEFGKEKQEILKKIRMENFQRTVLKTVVPFVAKIHWANLYSRYDPEVVDYLTKSDDVFRISLFRNDAVAQIKSNYISFMRNSKWHYRNNEQFDPEVMSINQNAIKRFIKDLVEYQRVPFVNPTDVKIDLSLNYEDISSLFTNSGPFVKTPPPINDQEIGEVVEQLYSDYIKKSQTK